MGTLADPLQVIGKTYLGVGVSLFRPRTMDILVGEDMAFRHIGKDTDEPSSGIFLRWPDSVEKAVRCVHVGSLTMSR